MREKIEKKKFRKDVAVQTQALMNVAQRLIESQPPHTALRYTFSVSLSVEPIPEQIKNEEEKA